jgi:hypothetical protein
LGGVSVGADDQGGKRLTALQNVQTSSTKV